MVDSPGGREVGRLSLKVLPDTSDFVPKLQVFVEKVEHQLKVEIPVELDFDEAFDDLRDAIRIMNGYANQHPVVVETEVDTAGAVAHLQATLVEMQTIASAQDINVELEVDGAGIAAAKTALVDTGAQGSRAMSRIGLQIALWGPLIFVAAVGIAAIAPALAVILPLVVGIAAAGAVVALGWDQVKKVVKPLADDFKQLRKEIGGALTEGLSPLIAKFEKVLFPVLSKGLVMFATFVNGALSDLLRFVNSSTGVALIGQLFTGLVDALAPFADLITYTTSVFLRLAIAALPALQVMGDAILGVTKDFNTFLKQGTASAVITDAMNNLGAILKVIGNLIADVFPAMMAAAPGVIALLSGMAETIGGMFKLLKPAFAFMSKHKTTMGALGAALTVVAVGLGLVAAATAVWNILMATNPIVLVVIALAALAAGLIYAYNHSEKFRTVVQAVWNAIKTAVVTAINFIIEHWKLFTTILLSVFLGPIGLLVGLVISNFEAIRGFIASAISKIVSTAGRIWDFVTVIVGAVGSLVSSVGTNIGKVVTYFFLLPGRIIGAAVGLAGELYSLGADAMRGMLNGIGSMAKALLDKAKSVITAPVEWAKDFLGISSPSKLFHQYGVWTMQGYQMGLESQASAIVNSMSHIMGGAADAAGSVFNPDSIRSATGGLSASIGAIVDNTDGRHAQEVIINWNTGRGVMVDISDEALARKEFVASQDQMMGVPS